MLPLENGLSSLPSSCSPPRCCFRRHLLHERSGRNCSQLNMLNRRIYHTSSAMRLGRQSRAPRAAAGTSRLDAPRTSRCLSPTPPSKLSKVSLKQGSLSLELYTSSLVSVQEGAVRVLTGPIQRGSHATRVPALLVPARRSVRFRSHTSLEYSTRDG